MTYTCPSCNHFVRENERHWTWDEAWAAYEKKRQTYEKRVSETSVFQKLKLALCVKG